MKPNEITVLKAVSTRLDSDTLLIMAYMYHSDPSDRRASQYRTEARIVKESTLRDEIARLESDAKRTIPYRWPTIEKFDLLMDDSTTGAKAAAWHKMRIKKALEWPKFLKVLEGFRITAGKLSKTANENAKWDVAEFRKQGDSSGRLFEMTDREGLLALGECCLSHIRASKRFPSSTAGL